MSGFLNTQVQEVEGQYAGRLCMTGLYVNTRTHIKIAIDMARGNNEILHGDTLKIICERAGIKIQHAKQMSLISTGVVIIP